MRHDDETPKEEHERESAEDASDDLDDVPDDADGGDSPADADVVGERADPVEKLMTWTEAVAAAAAAQAGQEPEFRVESRYEREFQVPASDEDIAVAGRESARLRGEAEVILEQRKHQSKVLKEQAQAKLTEAAPFDSMIRVGTKAAKEPVEVRVVFQMNAKLVVRLSTGEVIETRPLSADERAAEIDQRQLSIGDAIAKNSDAPPPPSAEKGDGEQPATGAQ